MKKLVLFKSSDKKNSIKFRTGESKFGEHITILKDSCNIYEQLLNLDVKYVIFGIPEDVGVYANIGNTGTSSAYEAVIKVLLNTQQNEFNTSEKVAVLGYLDCTEEQEQLNNLNNKKTKDLKKVRLLVDQIDSYVTKLVHDIVKAGKIPIIIGGGHNNAYGCVKGTSLALNKAINVINLDAHTGFRKEEGRHNGNAFSYAFTEGFLKRYFIFGIHENYTSQIVLNKIKKLKKHIKYTTFESIFVRQELKFKSEIHNALEFISDDAYGVEIDCDAIEGIASSAMTPTGISPNKARTFVSLVSAHENVKYFHICEAAPSLNNKKRAMQTSKMVSYLITDFLRANT